MAERSSDREERHDAAAVHSELESRWQRAASSLLKNSEDDDEDGATS